MATGAVSTWMRKPPIAGPATKEAERLVLSLLLAST